MSASNADHDHCRKGGHTLANDIWCGRCGDELFATQPAPMTETVRPRAAYQSLTTLAELVLDYACDAVATPASGDIAAKGIHFGMIARPAISLWGMRSAGGYGARA